MGKKSNDSDKEHSVSVQFLFSADNPFRRKAEEEPGAPAPPSDLGLGLVEGSPVAPVEERKRKRDKPSGDESLDAASTPISIPKKRKKLEEYREGEVSLEKRKKRKRDELEQEYEKKAYGVAENAPEGGEDGERSVAVGQKRKQKDVIALDMPVEDESFDDESKLTRTVFVGNLPLKIKRKALLKEFAKFGEVDSIRIRSVPIIDSKTPRLGAIRQGKLNEAIDSVHAYIVFKDEQSAKAALSQNMSEFEGHHIRVDFALPPSKKLKGEGSLYDRKKTVFIGNLPFDVKDEEIYQLFCGIAEIGRNLEGVRVVRDPHTSLGKGIAYVLFKTREAANVISKRKDLKIRDRLLRVCHAKSADAATPSKRKGIGADEESPRKRFGVTNGGTSGENEKPKAKAANLSYQGLRASKSGSLKKSNLHRKLSAQANQKSKDGGSSQNTARKGGKRPAVAARKAKQLLTKRKQESRTPESARRMNKKARRT